MTHKLKPSADASPFGKIRVGPERDTRVIAVAAGDVDLRSLVGRLRPDVVVLDLDDPLRTGLGLCRRIRAVARRAHAGRAGRRRRPNWRRA
jgi:CheY-like chemotaxis protein